MTKLNELTIAEARAHLRAGDITSVQLTEACLAAIAEKNPELNAFVTVTPDLAMEQAEAADKARAAGRDTDLLGIPLGVKDLFCVAGVRSQACSRILEGFVPSYDSTVTARLWAEGAVCLGKTNMDEFGMGSSTENSRFGPTVSPIKAPGSDAKLTAGGSSGGSAAAVAAHLCLGAIGTDTGGSIRQPAAFTGTVGIKPTYGRCSRWGIMAYASSLDQAGPMTKTVRDAAILLKAMAGHDPKDSTSADIPVPDYEAALGGDIRGRRVGIPREYREGLSDEISALLDDGAARLRKAGAEIVDVSLPHTKYALPAYYIIAPAEASSNLARYDGVRYGRRAALGPGEGVLEMYEKSRAEGFGPEVRRRVMVGAYVLSAGYYDAYYLQAQKVRALVKRDFDEAFRTVETLLTPVTPGPAFELGSVTDPVSMYLQDLFTITVNLAGVPSAAIGLSLSPGSLPMGLQAVAQSGQEDRVVSALRAIEAD